MVDPPQHPWLLGVTADGTIVQAPCHKLHRLCHLVRSVTITVALGGRTLLLSVVVTESGTMAVMAVQVNRHRLATSAIDVIEGMIGTWSREGRGHRRMQRSRLLTPVAGKRRFAGYIARDESACAAPAPTPAPPTHPHL